MASGAEMAITQGLKLAMRAAGIAPEVIERDVVRMVQSVLSFDQRMSAIEENQRRIMFHLGIVPVDAAPLTLEAKAHGQEKFGTGGG